MWQLHYNVFKKVCDANKYEELEMDTDSLNFALSEESLKDVILLEKKETSRMRCVREIAQHFHCQRNRQFHSQNKLQHTR